MNKTTKVVLGAVLLAGAAVTVSAWAMGSRSVLQNDGPMQGLERSNDRATERLQREYDVNHDGRVTRAEMNGVIGYRFAEATHHAATMTQEQFIAERTGEFRKSNEAMFHRLDWNGDGKLTLAEYGAAQRVRLVQFDRDGAGYVSCSVRDQASRGGRGGLNGFCRDNDTDMDGRVTRDELDAAIAKRFSALSGGTQAMVLTQFVRGEEDRYAVANVRQFRKLDTDEDGLLTLQEFATPDEALFEKLDKNRDGILTPAELQTRSTRSKTRLASAGEGAAR